MSSNPAIRRAICGAGLIGAGLCVFASSARAAQTISPLPQKPAWLNELSLGLKEGYDDNVYLSGADQRFMPPGKVSLKGRDSWVTTVSPRIGFDFRPLLGGTNTVQALSLNYTPDFVTYHAANTESHQAHRFANAIKLQHEAFSMQVDHSFYYIHGPRLGPSYPGGLLNAYSTVTVRERREQFQDRAKVNLRYDQDAWFARPTASLLYYELMTVQRPTTTAECYQNYPDRYDVNGGMDMGYKFSPDLAAVIGYRYGHQYQQQFSWDKYSTPSDYQRVLLGLEGRIGKWLKFEGLFGPDFRSYPGDTATHITPVRDHHPVKFYGEAGVAIEPTSNDTITFKFKRLQWVSSVGRLPCQDMVFDLNYRRKLTDQLWLDLGGRAFNSDYTSASLASGARSDWMITPAIGLRYAFTTQFSMDLGYSVDLGRNAQDGIVNPETRDFIRHIVSLGAQFKF